MAFLDGFLTLLRLLSAAIAAGGVVAVAMGVRRRWSGAALLLCLFLVFGGLAGILMTSMADS
jgi:hypothetical protein